MDRKELKPEEMDRVSGGVNPYLDPNIKYNCRSCGAEITIIEESDQMGLCNICYDRSMRKGSQLRIHT